MELLDVAVAFVIADKWKHSQETTNEEHKEDEELQSVLKTAHRILDGEKQNKHSLP